MCGLLDNGYPLTLAETSLNLQNEFAEARTAIAHLES
jgi:hypothetical protein